MTIQLEAADRPAVRLWTRGKGTLAGEIGLYPGSPAQVDQADLEALDRTWLTLGQDFVYSPDGSLGYLAMPDENAVTVFDTATWEVAAKIDTGRAPHLGTEPVWLQLSPDGSSLYVVNELSDNVLVVDTATHQVSAVISLRMCQVYLPLVLRGF